MATKTTHHKSKRPIEEASEATGRFCDDLSMCIAKYERLRC